MNFVFIDSTRDYPNRKCADNTKTGFMAKGLLANGHNVYVINSRLGNYNDKQEIRHNGVEVLSFKRGGAICYVKNIIEEFKYLKKIKEEKDNYAILTSTYTPIFLLDIILCKLLHYKILYLFHELRSSLRGDASCMIKIDHCLQDHLLGYFVDTILPISHPLWNFAKRFGKPRFMMPILADFRLPNNNIYPKGKHFAYCGAVDYSDAIDLIISAFKLLNAPEYSLKLVLYGDSGKIDKYKEDVRGLAIEILQNVEDDDLMKLYKTSVGVILPLNKHQLQDKYRFSQKVAEYVSCASPLITVNFGEMPYYFENMKNALLLEEFSEEELSKSMQYLIDNPLQAKMIGKEGFQVGVKHFDTYNKMRELVQFLKNTIKC